MNTPPAHQITVVGINQPAAVLSPATFEAKRMAMQLAHSVYEVTDARSQEAAAGALASVKSLATQIEDARKEAKAPAIEFGRQIDQLVKDFCSELDHEQRRLSLLVGAYQEAERRKLQVAREESERKERDRMAELELAERKRAAAENNERTGTLLPDLEEIRQEAAQDIVKIRQDAANAAVKAPEGAMIKKTWKFEVTNIAALFKTNPDLCTIEPNNAAIRAVLKNRQDIPGLRIWSETAAVLRATARTSLPTSVETYDY